MGATRCFFVLRDNTCGWGLEQRAWRVVPGSDAACARRKSSPVARNLRAHLCLRGPTPWVSIFATCLNLGSYPGYHGLLWRLQTGIFCYSNRAVFDKTESAT